MTALDWARALRPRTLPAAAVPVAVGAAHAWHLSSGAPAFYGEFQGLNVAVALVSALLIQVGTNLANDYYDHVKGADTPQRKGPARASASGAIEPRKVRNAAYATFLLAALLGLYLVFAVGWPVLAIGLASLVSGLLYTAGPKPLGYLGLGDLFVLVFFGPVAVMGTTYVALPDGFHLGDTAYIGAWLPASFLGLQVGFLATAILVVNNLRDIPTDRVAGKRTLAVRIGERATRVEYTLLLGLAYLMPLLAVARHFELRLLLPLATLPLAWPLLRRVWRHHADRSALNPALGGTAMLLLAFGTLTAIGLLMR